jgi:hypothetical protein
VVIDGGVDVALMDHLDKYPDATIDEKRGAMRAILAKSMGVHVDPETARRSPRSSWWTTPTHRRRLGWRTHDREPRILPE